MVHPAYLLNPGDMFQVEIEKVLFATGASKSPGEAKSEGLRVEAEKTRDQKWRERRIQKALESKPSQGEADADAAADAAAASETGDGEGSKLSFDSLHPEDRWRANNAVLRDLLKKVKGVLSVDSRNLTATQKKKLRSFRDGAKRFLSHPENSDIDTNELVKELAMQMKNHDMLRESFETYPLHEPIVEGDQATTSLLSSATKTDLDEKRRKNQTRIFQKVFADLNDEEKEFAKRIIGETQLTRDEMRNLGRLLKLDAENPIDNSRPYATPWRPRPFLAPFAFIPRYLEVNPNICAAIYLRHPVARKGMAEVPTPFAYLTNQLTHNWYVERGRK
jgi:ribosomal protein S4